MFFLLIAVWIKSTIGTSGWVCDENTKTDCFSNGYEIDCLVKTILVFIRRDRDQERPFM